MPGTSIQARCAALLAQRRTEQDLTRLRAAVAQAKRLMDDPQGFIACTQPPSSPALSSMITKTNSTITAPA